MLVKLRRFSWGQLTVLSYFLQHASELVTVSKLERYTPLADKSLGGVLSSLARTRVGEERLIEAYGRDTEGTGLRWRLNQRVAADLAVRQEVKRLLTSYVWGVGKTGKKTVGKTRSQIPKSRVGKINIGLGRWRRS